MNPLALVSVCGRSLAHSSNGANLEGGDGGFYKLTRSIDEMMTKEARN